MRMIGMCLGALLFAMPGYARAANDSCRSLSAGLEASLSFEGCDSPLGLCTTGQVRGARVNGVTRFVFVGIALAAGMPGVEADSTLSYNGRLLIDDARRGTLASSNVGLLDNARGMFTEIVRVEGGTGDFAGLSGTLFLIGSVSVTGGFTGELRGELCGP